MFRGRRFPFRNRQQTRATGCIELLRSMNLLLMKRGGSGGGGRVVRNFCTTKVQYHVKMYYIVSCARVGCSKLAMRTTASFLPRVLKKGRLILYLLRDFLAPRQPRRGALRPARRGARCSEIAPLPFLFPNTPLREVYTCDRTTNFGSEVQLGIK